MRLLDARSQRFRDTLEAVDAISEPYAVLSHTWGKEEVTFQDMMLPNVIRKEGYRKITETCRLALEQGLKYVWVDTCCIDKSSSAELTETINSMFDLYKGAAVCFVYLHDLEPQTSLGAGLKCCRWVKRGWTLQELLAAKKVRFYDQSWMYRGSKESWIKNISNVTGIHPQALRGLPLRKFSISERMHWASSRETTRVEDIAYCLLGVFGVHMPLIYGEGRHAFRRLQEEIVKHNNDMTIFAWNHRKIHPCCAERPCYDGHPVYDDDSFHDGGLFAESPSNFCCSYDIHRTNGVGLDAEFSLTNNGLKLKYHLYGLDLPELSFPSLVYFLRLGSCSGTDADKERLCVGLYLDKIGPDTFIRRPDSSCHFVQKDLLSGADYISSSSRPTFYIIVNPEQTMRDSLPNPRNDSLQFLPFVRRAKLNHLCSLSDRFWDLKENMFFSPPSVTYIYSVKLGYKLGNDWIEFVALCDYKQTAPTLRLFDVNAFPSLYTWLLNGSQRKDCPRWREIVDVEPEIEKSTNKLEFNLDGRRYLVQVKVTTHSLDDSLSEVMYKAKVSLRRLRSRDQVHVEESNEMSENSAEPSDWTLSASDESSDSDGGCSLMQEISFSDGEV